MVASTTPPLSTIDRVRGDINSATPSADTLRYLRAILGLDQSNERDASQNQNKKNSRVNLSPKDQHVDKSTAKRNGTTRSTPAVHHRTGSTAPTMGREERRKFATEMFNTTLRQLGQAVKMAKGTNNSLPTTMTSFQPHPSQVALQEISPNKGKTTDTCSEMKNAPKIDSKNCQNIAGLAFLALQYLTECDTGIASDEIPGLQSASLILLDRVITLRLVTEANAQARWIYQGYWKSHSALASCPGNLNLSLAQYLLANPDSVNTASAFKFATSMQSQMLRLMILRGPACIDGELILSLRADTQGSPVWMCIEGLRRHRQDAQHTGTQLRTISLAISKLCLPVAKPISKDPPPDNLFDLSCVALSIKIASWEHLSHQPDLHTDFWRPFTNSIKRYITTSCNLPGTGKAVFRWLGTFEAQLEENRRDFSVPSNLLEALLRAAPQLRCEDEIQRLTNAHSSLMGPVVALISHCQLTRTRLGSYKTDVQATHKLVWKAQTLFEGSPVLPISQLEGVLLHTVHLRKALVQTIQEFPPSGGSVEENGPLAEFQTSCIKLLCICVRFGLDQTQSALAKEDQSPAKQRANALLSTLVKNADALLDVEKSSSRSALPAGCAHGPMDLVASIICFLRSHMTGLDKETPIATATNQLQVRRSQLSWLLYLKSVQAREDIQQQIRILELSISDLAELPLADKRSGFLTLKYQRLASCYADSLDRNASKQSLQQAIEFDIKCGLLREAAEAALIGSSTSIWSKQDSNRTSLGKSLNMYASISQADALITSTDLVFYDSSDLPVVQRALVYERQLCYILEKSPREQQLTQVSSQLRFLLQILDQPEYKVFCLRLITSLMAVAVKQRINVLGTLIHDEQIRTVMSEQQTAPRSLYLKEFEPVLRLVLHIQYGLVSGPLDCSRFQAYLKELRQIVVTSNGLDSLRKVVDDPSELMTLLSNCVGFALMLENSSAARVSLGMIRTMIDYGCRCPDIDEVNILVQVGQVNMHLNDMESAHRALESAQTLIAANGRSSPTEIEWALAFAEYKLSIQDVAGCNSYIERARSYWERRESAGPTEKSYTKLQEQSMLCKAAYLTSKAAFRQGNLLHAAVCARQAVKVIAAVWLSISKAWQSSEHLTSTASTCSDLQGLTTEFSNLALSQSSRSTSDWNTARARYWREVSLYCSAFSNMGLILVHCGLVADALYFYEQGLKVATQAKLSTVIAGIQSELAILHARSGQTKKSRAMLEVPEIPAHCDASLVRNLCNINQAETYLLLGDMPTAQKLLSKVQLEMVLPDAQQSTEKSKAKATAKPSNGGAKRGAVKSQKSSTQTGTKAPRQTEGVPIAWKTVSDKLASLQSEMALRQQSEYVDVIGASQNQCITRNARQMSTQARHQVRAALKLFAEDAVNSVLAETAVALPVRYKSSRKSGRVSFIEDAIAQAPGTKDARRKGRIAGPSRREQQGAPIDGRGLLMRAHQRLTLIKTASCCEVPSEVIHATHKLLSQTALLSTALGEYLVPTSAEILTDILSPHDQLRGRAAIVTLSERTTTANNAVSKFPLLDSTISTDSLGRKADLRHQIELLPQTWSIVSIGLTEDRNELLVSRTSHGESPFVLRIPLARPDPSALDHEELDFESAKAELEEIVKGANMTAHDSRGSSTDKVTRKAWFAERQALDRRLATLLDNMENIWFGGFRGLLSAGKPGEQSVSKFAQSLNLTLNRHLPSRQKGHKTGKATKVELHSHVVDLFLTLGHPRESDLEDSVTDLIYFVIDVLQFNGENNAYDEIDFDAMLVEILDALHAYHEEVSSSLRDKQESHVILVMDKELQAFPWESLPCLSGRSVSRMSSLGAIWDRLDKMRAQAEKRALGQNGLVVSASKGTYILNPSKDLVSTEDTFRSLFEQQLSDFKAFVHHPPTEAEFETALRDSPLMLYFGHGGGAQYIRGRTIRKMSQCAVTLLMGCSSAKLTECGVYESHGTPWNYESGGSAAVVGTLWDVTDRDIDRFALDMMCAWGLTTARCNAGSAAKAERTSTKAGKRKAAADDSSEKGSHDVPSGRGRVSLDQAVAQARSSCLLKYLNGAAPVMYGIPVFLE